MRKILPLFVLLFLVVYGLNAQSRLNSTNVFVEIGDVELCPGEMIDVPVYIKGMKPNYRPLKSIYFHLNISDTSAFDIVTSYWDPIRKMGTPIITDIQQGLRGSMGYNYCHVLSGQSKYLPRLLFSWFENSSTTSFIPNEALPLFKVRIKAKKKHKAYLQLTPGSSYISAGVADSDKYNVVAKDSGWVNPPKDPIVTAGPDSVFCTGSKTKLQWASGGVKYEWTPLHNTGQGVGTGLTSLTVRDPDFIPKKTFYYTYEVKITNERGCWAKDTVTYVAVPNTVWMNMATDTIIHEGSSAKLSVEPTGNFPPFKVKWSPSEKVHNSTDTSTLTIPLDLPTLFSVEVTDRYGCSNENVHRVNIIGEETLSGFIDPFPITRCGREHNVDSIQLNVLLKGGSGNLFYQWYGYNLDDSPYSPYFDRENDPDPWVLFYGHSVFVCDIYDMTTEQRLILRDTVHVVPKQAIGKVNIGFSPNALDGTLCEGNSLSFYTDYQLPGGSAVVKWFVNGKERGESTESTYVINDLKKGDVVRYAVYSNLKCVMNSPKFSPDVAPDIEYWRTPAIILDTISVSNCQNPLYQVNLQNVGKTYNLTWLVNNKAVLTESKTATNAEFTTATHSFVPENYHDLVSCRVDEISSRCHTLDTLESASVKVNYSSGKKVKVKGIATSFARDLLCSDSSFSMRISSVENLGPYPNVRWMKYNSRTRKYEEIARYHNDCDEESYTYNTLGCDRSAHPNYYAQGYPINFFSQGEGGEHQFRVEEGDSIYCIVENTSSCFNGGAIQYDTSAKMPLKFYGKSDAQVDIVPVSTDPYCNDKEIQFVANAQNTQGAATYTWLLNDTVLTYAIKDTLTLPSLRSSDKIECIVNTDFKCVQGYPYTARAITNVSKLPVVVPLKDTIGCQNSFVTLRATGDAVRYEWFEWLASNKYLGDRDTLHLFSDSSRHYILKAYNADNCFVSDTVFVATLPDSVVSIQLQLKQNLPVCVRERLEFSSQIRNGGTAPKYTWYKNGELVPRQDTSSTWRTAGLKHNDTIHCMLTSDYATCRSKHVHSNKIVVSIYDSIRFTSSPIEQTVCKNDSVELWAEPSVEGKEYIYEWQYSLPDGSFNGTIASRESRFWIRPQKSEKLRLKVSDGGICPSKYVLTKLHHAVPITVSLNAINSVNDLEIKPEVCLGADSSKITFKAKAENAGTTAQYLFQRNGKLVQNSEHPKCETYLKPGDIFRVVVFSDTLTCHSKPVFSPVVMVKRMDTVLLQVSANDTICKGESILLNASGTDAYIWRDANSAVLAVVDTLRVQPSRTSTYYVESVHSFDCPKVRDSVRISVAVPVAVDLQKNKPEEWFICPFEDTLSVTMTAIPQNATSNSWYVFKQAGNIIGQSDHPVFTAKMTRFDSIYCVLFNDTLSCDNSSYISPKLTLDTFPTTKISVSPSQRICLGDTLTLNVSGGVSYLWSPAPFGDASTSANPVVKPVQTTVYTVQSTDVHGCAYQDSVLVVVLTSVDSLSVEIAADREFLCSEKLVSFTSLTSFDEDVDWYVNGVHKAKAPSYSYMPNHKDSVFASLTHSLFCLPNNPVISNMLKIERYQVPVLNMRADTTLCAGQSVNLEPVFVGIPSNASVGFGRLASFDTLSVVWTPATSLDNSSVLNPLATPTENTQYKLTAYYHPRCRVQDSVYVQVSPLKEAMLTLTLAQDSLCLGSEYKFEVQGEEDFPFQWFLNGRLTHESVSPQWMYIPAFGDSVKVVQNFGNACYVKSQIASQTVVPNVLNIHLSAGFNEAICVGDSVVLQGNTNAKNYFWTPEAYLSNPRSMQPHAFPSSDFTYYFHGKTGACVGIDSVKISVHPLPSLPLVENQFFCSEFADTSIVLSIQNPVEGHVYYWYEGNTDNLLSMGTSFEAEVGNYRVKVISEKGCKNDTATSVTVGLYPAAKAIILLDKRVVEEGEAVQFVSLSQNAVSHVWDFGDGTIFEGKEIQHAYATKGLYNVSLEVGSIHDCRSLASDTVRVHGIISPPEESETPVDPENYVFIPSAFAPNSSSHPKDKVFGVYGQGIQSMLIKVFDYTGTEVFASNTLGATWDGVFQGKLLPMGNYLYRIDITYVTGKSERREGTVTLIR